MQRLRFATTSEKIRENVVELLVYSIGGQETPSGEILPMYAPARLWLSSNHATLFFDDIFALAKNAQSQHHHSIKLLSAILRTCPQIASFDSSSFERFKILLEGIIIKGTNESSLRCLVLFKAFMQGRRDFTQYSEDDSMTHDIVMLACAILEKSMIDSSIQCQTLSLQTYGTLRSIDWLALDKEEGKLMVHFKCIMSQCEAKNTKVRSAACKAIGDFCTEYIPHAAETNEKDKGKLEVISNLVCDSMFLAISDDKAVVRSMVSIKHFSFLYVLGHFFTDTKLLLLVPISRRYFHWEI